MNFEVAVNSAPLKAKFCKWENWFFKQILYLKFASGVYFSKKKNKSFGEDFVCLFKNLYYFSQNVYAVKSCTCLPACLFAKFSQNRNFRSPYQKKFHTLSK